MTPDELAFAGVARQAELVREREISARELVETHLERIGRLDPLLNSFRVVMPERALAEADRIDAGGADGRPLAGVPLAIKDNMDLAGELTTHGSLAHGPPATADCDLVRRLRGAGAIPIGKTNLSELAIIADTESTAFGVTRNPWDPARSVAGSSGGSAAAVAAGLAPAATASDGGGSIRLPAANCGIFGLKPQRDRISLAPLTEHWYGLSAFGFHSRGVLDTALLLDATADRTPERPFTDATREPSASLRIAVTTRGAVPAPVDGELRAKLDEIAALLRSLGHRVTEAGPAYGDLGTSFLPRFFGGIAQDARSMPAPRRLARRTKGFARLGAGYRGPIMARVRADVDRHVTRLNRLFSDHDVLLTPMTARPPVRAGQWEGLGALRTFLEMLVTYPFAAAWNVTGQPAAAVPAGINGDGLPLAVQLVGRPHDEATVLSLAAQIEAERAWADRRPPHA